MKASIIGTGCMDLITGITLAGLCSAVIPEHVIKKNIEGLNRRKAPIYEKGLENSLKQLVET